MPPSMRVMVRSLYTHPNSQNSKEDTTRVIRSILPIPTKGNGVTTAETPSTINTLNILLPMTLPTPIPGITPLNILLIKYLIIITGGLVRWFSAIAKPHCLGINKFLSSTPLDRIGSTRSMITRVRDKRNKFQGRQNHKIYRAIILWWPDFIKTINVISRGRADRWTEELQSQSSLRAL